MFEGFGVVESALEELLPEAVDALRLYPGRGVGGGKAEGVCFSLIYCLLLGVITCHRLRQSLNYPLAYLV
jgi:hypothetical protein